MSSPAATASIPSGNTLKSSFLKDVTARGFVHQCTDLQGLDDALCKGPVTGYVGFDATASSLHVGSLMQIMWLRKLQEHGHKPLVLLGGATSRIGDPTFKDTARAQLSEETITENIEGILYSLKKFLVFGDGPTDAVLVNNKDWVDQLSYTDFLKDYGPHFTVNRMLSFDSVRLRLEREQPLTFLEFNYMILQALDYLHLYKEKGCQLQLGGSDQWGNIVNGTELIRRLGKGQGFGLTSPLVTTASGEKMGKSVSGALWLNESHLQPFDFWQFWRNTNDADVGRFLKIFTSLSLDEIAKIEALEGAALNAGKILLADHVTLMTHGASALAQVHTAIDGTYGGGDDTQGLPEKQISAIHESADGFSVVDLLIAAGFVATKGEAKRLILGGGARINDVPVKEIDEKVAAICFQAQPVKISSGKKRHIAMTVSG